MLPVSMEPLARTFAVDAAQSMLWFSIVRLQVATFITAFDDVVCTLAADQAVQLERSVGIESVSKRCAE